MFRIKSPLSIEYCFSKKKNKALEFILNLNNFRNTHYRILNDAKVKYKEKVLPQIEQAPKTCYTTIVYTVHKGDKRKFDVGNIIYIHQKFLEDALVESDKLFDDNSRLLPLVVGKAGDIDTDEPRVDCDIYNLMDEDDVKNLKQLLCDYIDTTIKRIKENAKARTKKKKE